MVERQEDLSPEERVQRARKQREDAAAARGAVDRIVDQLRKHLAENHFADRLYEQLRSTRRHA